MNQNTEMQVPDKSATFDRNAGLLLLLLMMIGLIWSRALLSIAHIAFLIVGINFYCRNRKRLKANALLTWSFLPLVFFIFGAWQQNFAKGNLDYLLTLSVYPIAAISMGFLLKHVGQKNSILLWVMVAIASLCLPVFHFVQNISGTYLMYAQAKTLPVWMDKDHVRYGLFLNAVLLLLVFYKPIANRFKYLLAAIILIATVLLAVRTAWVGAGIIVLVWGWMKLTQSGYRKMRWLMPFAVALFCFASYHLVPSVKGKVDYMIYDLQSFNNKQYNPSFSDGTRRAINSTAWQMVINGQQNLGWTEISPSLKSAFEKKYPGKITEFGWPFNQWLYWWLGAGWWTMLLFSAWLMLPVYYGIRKKNIPLMIWSVVIIASCLVESTLSLQYGVFLHAWIVAFAWLTSTRGNYENQIT